jgi:4-hydroxy-4-methyl-2-oxoglutarate aldolase
MTDNERSQWALLQALGTATLHEAQGQRGAVASAIRPLDPATTVAGRALTVDCRPDDNLALHCALAIAQPGDVIVADAKGFVEAGPWGDLMTLSAMKRGVIALVIDGAVRDSQAIIEMGFPVFCRGVSIKGTLKNQPGTIGQPIMLGGVMVRTGDILVGDRDGLVVIARESVGEVIAAAQQREAKESAWREDITEGSTLVQLAHLEERLRAFGMPLTRAELERS